MPLAISGMMTPGVVAQGSGCSITGVRSIDLERRRCINLCFPSLILRWDRDVM